MTEQEWLDCYEPEKMLSFLRGKASERKLRMMAFDAGSILFTQLSYAQSKRAIEMMGEYIENRASQDDYESAAVGAWTAAGMWGSGPLFPHFEDRDFEQKQALHRAVAMALEHGTEENDLIDLITPLICLNDWLAACECIIDIFCNPFRPVSFNPEWRISTVVALAKSMYESRDFSTMPLLGDALQDAGCEHDDILTHCRSNGPHVKGCWVVDLVLGKE